MDNTIVIDLVLAAVLVVFALRGARKGLIRSLMELVSVVLALAGAAVLTAMLVEPVTDLVFPRVEEKVISQFEQSVTNGAEAPETGVETQLPADSAESGGLLPESVSGLLNAAAEKLKRFGVSDDAIGGVADSVNESLRSAAEQAAYLLVKTIVQAVVFLLSFLALMLLLRLLTRALDELCALPVLLQINMLGGAAFSLVEGALLLFLIIFLAPRFGVTWFMNHEEGTHLLAWFMNNTPRSIIASLT